MAAEHGCFQSSDNEVGGFVFRSQPLHSLKCSQAPELAQNTAKFSWFCMSSIMKVLETDRRRAGAVTGFAALGRPC